MRRDVARRVLDVPAGAPLHQVETAFRRRAQELHPDHGGDPAAFLDLLAARRALGRGPSDRLDGHTGERTRLVVRHTGPVAALRRLRSRFPVPAPGHVRATPARPRVR